MATSELDRRDRGREESPCGRQSPDWNRPNMSMKRIVLVGKTGAGKSSSGNTIFGRKVFRSAKSGCSVTKECWKVAGEVAGTLVEFVDTPGLFDTQLSEDKLKHEITKCINMTSPGPHAIVLVIQLGPFTEEERLSVERIRAIFGEEADKHAMVLFTHGDELTSDIEEYLKDGHKDLRHLIKQCGERYHVFDNTAVNNRAQVVELLEKIESLVAGNDNRYYTSDMFEDVERTLEAKAVELQNMYEMKIKGLENDLTSKFQKMMEEKEKEIKALQESVQEKEEKIKKLEHYLEERKERELKELRRYFKDRQRAARMEAEEMEADKNVRKVYLRLQKLSLRLA